MSSFREWTPQRAAIHNAKVPPVLLVKQPVAAALMAESREREVNQKTSRLKAANGKSEGQIQQEIDDFLASLGPRVWYVRCRMDVPTTFTREGIPDIIGGAFGTPFAWEVKVPGKKPTKEQRNELYWANCAGFKTAVIHSLEEAKAEIAAINARIP